MQRKRYGFHNFIIDAFATCCTGGFWLIWVYVREHRSQY